MPLIPILKRQSRQISFEVSPVYKVNSGTVRTIQENLVLKNKQK